MKIGLIRHFKVDKPHGKLMTPKEFENTIKYKLSYIRINSINLSDVQWNKCYSSNLPRALKTAKLIFKDNITVTELLKDVPVSPVINSEIKLPYVIWSLIGRSAWLGSHSSQKETLNQTKIRVKNLLDNILSEEETNILLVSHSLTMFCLERELLNLGFKGEKFLIAKYGKLYIYER